MPSDTPTPAEIAATHHIRSYQYPAVLCGCGQKPELDNPPKVDFFAGAELLRALHAEHLISALSEHYHLLPKAGPDPKNPTPALIEAAYVAQDDLSKPPEQWAIDAAAEVIGAYLDGQGHETVWVIGHPRAAADVAEEPK